MPLDPWASGPAEILQHGLSLMRKTRDSDRRLAMLSIDNSVELMVKTYLGLPRRVTGVSIGRRRYNEISESFPDLLDALEEHCGDKLDGVNLGEIEWFHRLRNQLYHQGNGLTVEREKVEVYAAIAKLLFRNLFGEDVPRSERGRDPIAEFFLLWMKLGNLNRELVKRRGGPPDDSKAQFEAQPGWWVFDRKDLGDETIEELLRLVKLRDSIVYEKDAVVSQKDLRSLDEICRMLQKMIAATSTPRTP